MYAAYQSGQFASRCPVRFSCSPWAASARRRALARSFADAKAVVAASMRPGTVAKQFRDARRLAGLPETLKLYGARHAFATYAVQATGNVFAVADAMGHEDLKTTRIYQHPEMDSIRDAIDQRNNRRVM